MLALYCCLETIFESSLLDMAFEITSEAGITIQTHTARGAVYHLGPLSPLHCSA
jgi:hypothetical protein